MLIFCNLVAQAISAGLLVYRKLKGKTVYWLHSLLMTGCAGFTGGILAPLLIGERPLPFGNDFIFIFVCLSWFSVFHLGSEKFWAHPIPKLILSILLALFRTHSCINMVMRANSALSPNKYEGVAIFGPIFTATFMGTAGMFFPQKGDGFSAIEVDTPWALQGAFITSTFTHIMINDKVGFLGNGLRALIGTHSLDNVTVLLATMHIFTNLTQIYLSPNGTLFEQFHKVLYLITGVNGPKFNKIKEPETISNIIKKTKYTEFAMHFLVMVVSLAIFCARVPPLTLEVGKSISSNSQGVATCQIFSNYRGCVPYSLVLKETKTSLSFGTSTWNAPIRAKPDGGILRADIDEIGTLRVVSVSKEDDTQIEKVLYSSTKKCHIPSTSTYLTMGEKGNPVVVCGDNSIISL